MTDNCVIQDTVKESTPSGLRNNFHGGIHQLKMIMLFAIRGIKNGDDYKIISETKEDEGLDDIIYVVNKDGKETRTYFQIKHTLDETKKITILNSGLKKYVNGFLNINKKSKTHGFEIGGIYLCRNLMFNRTEDLFKSECNTDMLKFQNFKKNGSPTLFYQPNYNMRIMEQFYDDDAEKLALCLAECFYSWRRINENSSILEKYFVALIYGKVIKKTSVDHMVLHHDFLNDDFKYPQFRKMFLDKYLYLVKASNLSELRFEYSEELKEAMREMNVCKNFDTCVEVRQSELETVAEKLYQCVTNEKVPVDFKEFGMDGNQKYGKILVNVCTKVGVKSYTDTKRNYKPHFRDRIISENAKTIYMIFLNKFAATKNSDNDILKDLKSKSLYLQKKIFQRFSHEHLTSDEQNNFIAAVGKNENVFDSNNCGIEKLLGCMFVYDDKETNFFQYKVRSTFFQTDFDTEYNRSDLNELKKKLSDDFLKKTYIPNDNDEYLKCIEKDLEIICKETNCQKFCKMFYYVVNLPNIDEIEKIIEVDMKDDKICQNESWIPVLQPIIFSKLIEWFKNNKTTTLKKEDFLKKYISEGKDLILNIQK